MDTAHWPQEIVIKPMEEKVVQKSTNSSSLERRTRPQKESAINCPRCNSTNTKFCYYNNYSLSQPRYFCKTCRRYWTEGGSLRNVPVGGGSRKNKRSSYNSSMSKKLPDLVVTHAPSQLLSQNPRMHDQEHGQDLNLGFGSTGGFKAISELIQVPNFDHGIKNSTHLSALMNSFMPIPNPPNPDHDSVYSSSGQLMIPMSEFKIPSLNFSLDGTEVSGNSGGAYGTGIQESSSGRLLFPFDDLKTSTITSTTTSTSNTHDGHNNLEQNRDQNGDANGFWTGMLRGGSW